MKERSTTRRGIHIFSKPQRPEKNIFSNFIQSLSNSILEYCPQKKTCQFGGTFWPANFDKTNQFQQFTGYTRHKKCP